MLYPTIADLTKGNFNRYELAIATAKCARLITDEYVRQREAAEKQLANNKEGDKPMISMIDSEYRDEKAVKSAIKRLHEGEFAIYGEGEEPVEETAEETVLSVEEDVSAEAAEAIAEESTL